MTTYCVSSVLGAGGTGTGLSWANAALSIAAGLALATPTLLQVDASHNFTASAAITWTPPATGCAIVSGTPTGPTSGTAFTPYVAGAIESVGASSNLFTIASVDASSFYVYGVTCNGGSNNSGSCDVAISGTTLAQNSKVFDHCTFTINSVATTAQILLGAGASGSIRANEIGFYNCTFRCATSRLATLILIGQASIKMISPTFVMSGASKPVVLFAANNITDAGSIYIKDADMTGYAVSGGAYFDVSAFGREQVILENTKISATPTLLTGTWPAGIGSILLRNVDSGNTTYVFHYANALGTLDAEVTDYVTTGGAQFNGAPIAWKVVTTGAASEFNPFVLPPLSIWTTLTTAQTYAIEIAQVNGAAALTDRQIWSDIEYAASASFPNYTWQSNRSAGPFITTGVAHATSTNPWTVPNIGANPVTQKLQSGTATTPAAFTAAATGLITSQISIGVATLTLWINPAIDGIANTNNGQTVWTDAGPFTKQANVLAGGGAVFGAVGGVIA
jgi:hypothetical protein